MAKRGKKERLTAMENFYDLGEKRRGYSGPKSTVTKRAYTGSLTKDMEGARPAARNAGKTRGKARSGGGLDPRKNPYA